MTTALAPRRMLLSLFVVAAALLFVGAGQALAAQRPPVAQWTMSVDHDPVAYADGSLTVARHGARKRPVAHAKVRSFAVTSRKPVAYADGLLTVARHHHQHRRILAHAA